jgi:exopolysaccharide biosynthesis polyprenyl glycosylphosphotransferase
MKRSELFFSFILVPVDFIMIILAGISAYYLRASDMATGIRPILYNLPFADFLLSLAVVALFWLVVFAIAGLYRARGIKRFDELNRVFFACFAGFGLIVIYIFFFREWFSSRFIILVGWLLAWAYVSVARLIVRWVQKQLFHYGIGVHRVVIIGRGASADKLIKEWFSHRSRGYQVVKHYDDFSLETAQELEEYLKLKPVDEIIQADPNLSKAEVVRLYDFSDEYHLTFKYIADLLDTKVLQTEVEEVTGIPVVEVKKTTLDGWGRISKRLFDIIVSGFSILILSPIYLLTAVAIKLDSTGPVFFSHLDDGSPLCRIGQAGRKFRYLKFRSMVPGTDSLRYTTLADQNIRGEGPMVKIKDDPRVTRVGKFIRRFSLDELPEFFLVFVGSMSLVGPRPHLPEEVAKYERHHKKVLTIKPGITGLAQVSGRSDLSFEEEVKLDVYYIENWSLAKDIRILLNTPMAVLRHRQVV